MRVALTSAIVLFGAAATASEPAPIPVSAPEGFVEVTVAGVLSVEDSPVVILRDRADKRIVPIMIGASEALAIQLRLDRRRFERPLTHDLLDSVLAGLGGELVKVQVDDLRDSVYVATLSVRVGDKILDFDARPSDSIALAVGSRVPIFVSRKVLDRVGVNENLRFESARQPEPRPSAPNVTTL